LTSNGFAAENPRHADRHRDPAQAQGRSTRSFADMNISARIFTMVLAIGPGMALGAESECTFEDTSHRRISGDNPSDFLCIQMRARGGDEHWQYYLGLILVGDVPGPKDIPQGLAVLQEVARRSNKYSTDAMRIIGYVYKRPNTPYQDYELAYQWLFLASRGSIARGSTYPLPDEELNSVLSPQRMKELERDAQQLVLASGLK
jgi:hypothetical protein